MPKRNPRKTPMSYLEMTLAHTRKMRPPKPMTKENIRTFGEMTQYSQKYVMAQMEREASKMDKRQWPYEGLHRVMRRAGMVHCEIGIDPPNWLDAFDWIEKPRKVKDKYGRILFMTRGLKERKRIRPEDFAPLPDFEPLYEMHPNPAMATEDEKEKRIAAFLNAYSMTGLRTPSARYVGVNYYQLILWINEREEWQSQLLIAQEAAKLLMVDIGKQRAMAGDSSMLKFFIERDNPDTYGRGKTKQDSELPEGVTQDSVASALSIIQKAQQDAAKAESALPPALVNQTAPPLEEIITVLPPSVSSEGA